MVGIDVEQPPRRHRSSGDGGTPGAAPAATIRRSHSPSRTSPLTFGDREPDDRPGWPGSTTRSACSGSPFRRLTNTPQLHLILSSNNDRLNSSKRSAAYSSDALRATVLEPGRNDRAVRVIMCGCRARGSHGRESRTCTYRSLWPSWQIDCGGCRGHCTGMNLLGFAQASSVGPKKALDICLLRVFTGVMGAMGVPWVWGRRSLR